MEGLGERLRHLRENRNYSIYDIERQTGLHFSTISRYERNERNPPLDVLAQLAAVYEVPVGYLIYGETDLDKLLPGELVEGARLLESRRSLFDLMRAAENLSEAQLDAVIQIVKMMAR